MNNVDISKNIIKYENNNLHYFIKYSPLVNPIKYVMNEYNFKKIKLPSYSSNSKKKYLVINSKT